MPEAETGEHQVVSIHAPAWGATAWHTQGSPEDPVSIHAPAWGATWIDCFESLQKHGFNPRPRVGGDQAIPLPAPSAECFNPRPRVGGDC